MRIWTSVSQWVEQSSCRGEKSCLFLHSASWITHNIQDRHRSEPRLQRCCRSRSPTILHFRTSAFLDMPTCGKVNENETKRNCVTAAQERGESGPHRSSTQRMKTSSGQTEDKKSIGKSEAFCEKAIGETVRACFQSLRRSLPHFQINRCFTWIKKKRLAKAHKA